MGVAFAVLHALQFQAVRIEEKHGIIVFVVFGGRIDDRYTEILEKGLQLIDIFAAAQLERIMVEADVADAVFVLLALGICWPNPESGIAIGPADCVLVLLGHVKAEEGEQPPIEGFRFFVIAYANDQMVDANHSFFTMLGRHARCSAVAFVMRHIAQTSDGD